MARKIEAYGNSLGTDSVRKTTEGSTTVKTGAGNLDTVVVGKTGDLCKLTIKDDTTTIYEGYLDDQFLRMGLHGVGHTLDFASMPFDTSLKVELHVPAATTHYKMNSITGSTVIDSGSNATNATCTNMANEDWIAGMIHNGLDFDSVDDYVTCGNVNAFETDEPFSIVFWLKQDDHASTEYFFAKRQVTSEKGYGCFTDNSGIMYFHILGTPNTGSMIVKTQTNLTLDDWEHYAITYDGSEDAEGIKIYRNRTLMGTTITDNDIAGTMVSTTAFQVGAMRGSGNGVDGTIDDFRVYDEELSAEQVSLIYNQGVGTYEDFSLGEVSITYN